MNVVRKMTTFVKQTYHSKDTETRFAHACIICVYLIGVLLQTEADQLMSY